MAEAKYVKFNRGSLAAYQKAVKNSDTLYFVINESGTEYSIYLGDKPVAGGLKSLSEVEDIVLTEVADGQLLVYDEASGKWVNQSVKSAIGEFVGATAEAQGQSGLVPAPGIGQTNLFLRSDGSWAEVSSSEPVSATKVFQTTPVDEETHIEALERVIGATALNVGDIGIVKVLIVNDKCEYTAYVYDGENWAAMDGNYSAENVYFKNDLTYTADIGVLTVPASGSGELAAAGKSVKDVFASILAKEENPEVTEPSLTITLNSSGVKEVGSVITPSYSTTFKKGSYAYGPDTGITATYKVTNNANADEENTAASGTFNQVTITDGMNYSVSATAEYTQGAIPVTNLGNEVESLRIDAGSLTATSSGKYTGYRAFFYGTLTEKAAEDELVSSLIRGLTKSTYALTANKEITVSVPLNAMQVIFAYPATLADLSSVTDTNAMGAQIVTSFDKYTAEVEGANGYDSIEYKVFVAEFADPNDTVNTYKFKI